MKMKLITSVAILLIVSYEAAVIPNDNLGTPVVKNAYDPIDHAPQVAIDNIPKDHTTSPVEYSHQVIVDDHHITDVSKDDPGHISQTIVNSYPTGSAPVNQVREKRHQHFGGGFGWGGVSGGYGAGLGYHGGVIPPPYHPSPPVGGYGGVFGAGYGSGLGYGGAYGPGFGVGLGGGFWG